MLRPTLLLLTAALLVAPNAVPAQAPPSAPTNTARLNAADLKWHGIILHHTTPGEVIERMNWKMAIIDPYAKNQNPPLAPTEANLPEGVMRMFSLTSNNTLLIEATNTGFEKVEQAVKILDVGLRQVTPDSKDKATLRWFKIAVAHKKASDIVQEMHWDNLAPYSSVLGLSDAVEHISIPAGDGNDLWLHATVEGFEETKSIVKLLDKPGYEFAPTLTFVRVPPGDTHFHWIDGPTQGLEVSIIEGGTKYFQDLTEGGAVTKTISIKGRCRYDPIDLCVDGPYLHSDSSVTLDFTYGNWNGPAVRVSGIRPGSVLVVRDKYDPQITLIQVNY